MNQIESQTPSFFRALRRLITKKRYTCATISVDHFSGFTYVHLQNSINTEETLKTKRDFQIYYESIGVKILHYHSSNDRFDDEGFMHAIEPEGKKLLLFVVLTRISKMERRKIESETFKNKQENLSYMKYTSDRKLILPTYGLTQLHTRAI